MCIAVPSPILDITPGILPMATVDHGGKVVTCSLMYVPEAQVGDYVIIQNGFAIEVMDPEAAALSLAAFAELADNESLYRAYGGPRT